VVGLFLNVPTWAGIFLCGLTGLSFLVYLFSYGYLLLYYREALRRERLRVKGRQVQERGWLVSASSGLTDDQSQLVARETRPLRTVAPGTEFLPG
jgi:hypothetical protein